MEVVKEFFTNPTYLLIIGFALGGGALIYFLGGAKKSRTPEEKKKD